MVNMVNISLEVLREEIAAAIHTMDELEPSVRRLWDLVCIPPIQWTQGQYAGAGQLWVIALMGNRCLYYNPIESGWGWGHYLDFGKIYEYHWQQDEIQHAIYQMLVAIEKG